LDYSHGEGIIKEENQKHTDPLKCTLETKTLKIRRPDEIKWANRLFFLMGEQQHGHSAKNMDNRKNEHIYIGVCIYNVCIYACIF
jgi:hypothetical protein